MAIVPFSSLGIGNAIINDFIPFITLNSTFPPAISAPSLNTAIKKHAQIGRIFWSDAGTHNIAAIGAYYGANTTGTATFRVSLQDVSTSNPLQPDGTPDQSWTSATPPTSNAWSELTFDGGAVRASVAHGTLLAAVWDYSAFTASSNFRPSYWSGSSSIVSKDQISHPMDLDGTWFPPGGTGGMPLVVFKSDDATPVYGCFASAWPFRAINSHAFNSGSNPKVHALSYTPVCDQQLAAVKIVANLTSNTADFDFVLYSNAGAVLASVSVDVSQIAYTATGSYTFSVPMQYKLVKDINYRIGIRPTTAGNITMRSCDLHDANYRKLLRGGTQMAYTTLSSGDVWAADTTTRIPLISLEISGMETAAAGGFSPLITELS